MKITIAILSLVTLIATSACRSTRIDPLTGQPVSEFDPVKTEQVKAALEPIGSSLVRRVIVNSPQNSDEIATYLRGVGSIFCQMSANNDFDPVYLASAAEVLTAKYQAKLAQEIIDLKNALIAIYKINYESRFRAELSPEEWPKNVADLICAVVDRGLKDAGKPGVK